MPLPPNFSTSETPADRSEPGFVIVFAALSKARSTVRYVKYMTIPTKTAVTKNISPMMPRIGFAIQSPRLPIP